MMNTISYIFENAQNKIILLRKNYSDERLIYISVVSLGGKQIPFGTPHLVAVLGAKVCVVLAILGTGLQLSSKRQ